MGEFFSELKEVLGVRALKRVAFRTRDNDLLGLAGQLAYSFLLSFFPFLIFLVSLAGLVLKNPESAVRGLIVRTAGFLPQEAVHLLARYLDGTLRSAGTVTLLLSIVGSLWIGSGAAIAITKAANRAYGVSENRPFWKLRGTSLLIALGFTLLIAALTLVVFEVQLYVSEPGGSSGALIRFWSVWRWALAFVVVAVALDILFYLAPDARMPFKWITPGGVIATVLMFSLSVGLSLYVTNLGNYGRIYGQLGAVVILMIWLYITGLTVLIGIEINAVLALLVEEKRGEQLVEDKNSEDA